MKSKRVIVHESSVAADASIATLESLLRSEDPTSALEAEPERPAQRHFLEFTNRLREELAPAGRLEEILVERVILSAWRVQTALRAEEIWTLHEATGQQLLIPERLKCQPLNDLRRDSKAAETGLTRAMKNLELHRSMRAPQWGKSTKTDPREAPCPTFEPEPTPHASSTSVERPWRLAETNPDRSPETATVESAPMPRWQDRLVYDFNVSETSPVVKGTWVTVNHIVSLVVDGWTWADILRSHPELSEEDIRTCLSFATEADEMHL